MHRLPARWRAVTRPCGPDSFRVAAPKRHSRIHGPFRARWQIPSGGPQRSSDDRWASSLQWFRQALRGGPSSEGGPCRWPGRRMRDVAFVLGTPCISRIFPCFWYLPSQIFKGAHAAAGMAFPVECGLW